MGNFVESVLNPARLAALRRLGLLDTPAEAAFDRLGKMAANLLKTPIALVTLVDDNRQFFKSCIGLPEPWATWRNTPLSYSFCKHVVASDEPLIISDARECPVFSENLAVKDLGVVAYLGIPLRMGSGEVLGSFCVIDSQPRVWTEQEIHTLKVLTDCVMTEIELRAEILHRKDAMGQVSKLNTELEGKAAMLETANKELEAFAHAITHDLGSPVRASIAFSELLASDEKLSAEERKEFARQISQATHQINDLVSGLLVLGRIKKADVHLSAVDLSGLARRILERLATLEPQRKVKTEIQSGVTAAGDRRMLLVLMENILGNAWKFTSRRGDARIQFGAFPSDGRQVFFVRDNGVGFDQADAEKMFVPFGRLHSREMFAGSGIGLSTVERIVQRHGGKIWAEGKEDIGATIFVSLPGDSAKCWSLMRREKDPL